MKVIAKSNSNNTAHMITGSIPRNILISARNGAKHNAINAKTRVVFNTSIVVTLMHRDSQAKYKREHQENTVKKYQKMKSLAEKMTQSGK